jgi:hypothetical protein
MTVAPRSSRPRRRSVLAWTLSVAVHGIAVFVLLLAGRAAPRPPLPAVPVRLAPPAADPSAPPPEPSPPPVRTASDRPPVRPGPRRVPGTAPPPSGPPADEDARWRPVERESSRAIVQWWGERSLAAWVEGLREGDAPRDSLLDPTPPPPEEVALDAMDRSFRREFRMRAPDWERERFLEAYRRNFPLMR